MRTHPRLGHDILASIPERQIAAIAMVVLHHHEAVDGMRLPGRTAGRGHPVLAPHLSIVDPTMPSATVRPYHARKSHAEVIATCSLMRS
jgi:two-component system response regulator RpfG